jgi:hypothetical protein
MPIKFESHNLVDVLTMLTRPLLVLNEAEFSKVSWLWWGFWQFAATVMVVAVVMAVVVAVVTVGDGGRELW